MRKREGGQAFIMVLILLGIGSLLVVPALRLTDTSLKSTQIVTRQNTGIYAAEAAQEKVMWMLYHGDLTETIALGGTYSDTVDVCGVLVHFSVTMRAVEFEGGVVLAGDDTIMPTKTVSPSEVDDPSQPGRDFTYTIEMKQVSTNSTLPQVAVHDILPAELGKQDVFVSGSTEISYDGVEWDSYPDPSFETGAQQVRLRWPASGNFTPDFGHFDPGEVKYLRFDVNDTLQHDNVVACNWVILEVGDIFTLSGPQAPIVVGDPPDPDGCQDNGLFSVTKVSDPTVIPPLVSTDITYDVNITNMDGNARHIAQVDDYLPPGFEYIGPTEGITDIDPYSENLTLNGVERQHLWWDEYQLGASGVLIAGGANATLTFVAQAKQGVSGSYYNEVLASPQSAPSPHLFTNIDPDYNWGEAFSDTYSWNSGMVIVPSYDSSTGSDGANISANMGLTPDGVTILSWQFK